MGSQRVNNFRPLESSFLQHEQVTKWARSHEQKHGTKQLLVGGFKLPL